MSIKGIILAGAALALISTPVLAANTAIIIWNTANPGGAEAATGTDTADVATSNLNGVTVTLSFVNRGTLPNDLTEGNIQIKNTDSATQTLKIIAGANGYLGPSDAFKLSGTIGATLGGSDFAGEFFADNTNSLNGESLSVTGTSLNSFDSGGLLGPQSFSFNGFGVDAVTGPYGLAEELTLTLKPGATVFVQGLSMDAVNTVPEPSTWAMMLGGFALIGFLGLRKRRAARFAV